MTTKTMRSNMFFCVICNVHTTMDKQLHTCSLKHKKCLYSLARVPDHITSPSLNNVCNINMECARLKQQYTGLKDEYSTVLEKLKNLRKQIKNTKHKLNIMTSEQQSQHTKIDYSNIYIHQSLCIEPIDMTPYRIPPVLQKSSNQLTVPPVVLKEQATQTKKKTKKTKKTKETEETEETEKTEKTEKQYKSQECQTTEEFVYETKTVIKTVNENGDESIDDTDDGPEIDLSGSTIEKLTKFTMDSIKTKSKREKELIRKMARMTLNSVDARMIETILDMTPSEIEAMKNRFKDTEVLPLVSCGVEPMPRPQSTIVEENGRKIYKKYNKFDYMYYPNLDYQNMLYDKNAVRERIIVLTQQRKDLYVEKDLIESYLGNHYNLNIFRNTDYETKYLSFNDDKYTLIINVENELLEINNKIQKLNKDIQSAAENEDILFMYPELIRTDPIVTFPTQTPVPKKRTPPLRFDSSKYNVKPKNDPSNVIQSTSCPQYQTPVLTYKDDIDFLDTIDSKEMAKSEFLLGCMFAKRLTMYSYNDSYMYSILMENPEKIDTFDFNKGLGVCPRTFNDMSLDEMINEFVLPVYNRLLSSEVKEIVKYNYIMTKNGDLDLDFPIPGLVYHKKC